MEIKYLDELEVLAICFNNLRETAFILFKNKINKIKKNQIDNLNLVEQDIHHKIIYKRFKILQESECILFNVHFQKYPNNSYEGYCLYFWQASEKLFVIYPFGYILIYDYNSADLLYHFQSTIGKHIKISKLTNPMGRNYALQNIVGSPIENCLFITCENRNYFYCVDYSLISKEKGKCSIYDLFENKITIPKDTKIYDIIVHPNQKFVYAGFSDGAVRVYDYNDLKNIKQFSNNLREFNVNISVKVTGTKTLSEGDPVICLDINNIGSYLLEGTSKGYIYLWDAFLANKNKKIMYKKEVLKEGILSLKFIKTKQFGNMQKFICLSKKGDLLIYYIIAKDDSVNLPVGRKIPMIEIVYKKNIFKSLDLSLSILKYNINLNSLINISYNNNIISISFPNFVKIQNEDKKNKEEYNFIYSGLTSKIYFFYNATYPKINYPSATQLRNRLYEEYIPIEGQPNFENKIYYADNYHVYLYEISTSRHRKLFNYSKEYKSKNLYLTKFEAKALENSMIFFILIETQLHRNNLILIKFNFENNSYDTARIIYNINDFVILGNSNYYFQSNYAFLLGRDMTTGYILKISTGDLQEIKIDSNIVRTYHSPFNQGYCIIYRNIKNEYKFSQNFTPEIFPPNNNENIYEKDMSSFMNFKCGDLFCFKLKENEHVIDILFNIASNNNFCAVSLLDKINIYNREMKLISTLKLNFEESPYIVSSIFFLDSTLIYSKNESISYFYPKDNIEQLIFRNNRKPIYISGVLPDRFVIISQTDNKNISISDVTSPMLNPLEPILIGYLDSPNINYDLVKLCVVNLFTNQISQSLIDKLINRNLKEIAWLFIDDDKSTFQNMNIKLNLLNEKYKFENIIESILANKPIKSKLDLDEIIWKFRYDKNYEYIKELLKKELKILIEFGQYNSALKILELIGEDYPLALNLLLISTSPEDFDQLKIKFEAKEAINFTDNLLINNMFTFSKKEQKGNQENNINENEINANNNNDIFDFKSVDNYNKEGEKLDFYHKIFDNYEGEHFTFGANLNEFQIESIDNLKEIIEEKNGPIKKGYDEGIQKKVINFGEKPFTIYSEDYSMITKEMHIIEIYSLILQKIENYYGIIKNLTKNEKEKMKRKMSFFNYNLTLAQVNKIQNGKDQDDDSNFLKTYTVVNKSDFAKKIDDIKNEDINEDDIDLNDFDDVSEELYLMAYYHCDKGNGEILEDITQNQYDAVIKCIYNANDSNAKKDKKDDNNDDNEMKNIWSEVLDENRPLEYEDKWGRRSPPPHSIIFTKNLKTKIIISNSYFLQNITDRFTIELWIKLKDINDMIIFNKDLLDFGIDKGQFKLTFHDQEFTPEVIKEYKLDLDQFMHVAIIYKKSLNALTILLNCEEIIKFPATLSGIENNSPLIFGNERFDGEMTEIRIWNQSIPVNFIKENYKIPLPILAENKGRLQMNINIKEKRRKFDRNDSVFLFGDKNKSFIESKDRTNLNSDNYNLQNNDNNNIIDEFENINIEDYPTLDLVNSKSQNINLNTNNQMINNELFCQEKDFNFDK